MKRRALPWMKARGVDQLMAIGLGWLMLTLVLESSFGLWQGKPWPVLLEAYTFKDGNLWPVVLLVTAMAPYIAGRFRGRSQDPGCANAAQREEITQ